MRKWFFLFALFLVLLTVGVYVLIPNKVTLRQETHLRVNANAFTRAILDESSWKEWWPGEVVVNPLGRSKNSFVFNGNRYVIHDKHLSSHVIMVHYNDDSLLSQLFFIPATSDSITLSWQATNTTSYFPLKRINRYQTLKALDEDWETILQSIQRFYRDEDKLYGLSIRKESVKDSMLISTIIHSTSAPSTDTIYHLIGLLTDFAEKKGAKQTGFPMLNTMRLIREDKSVHYRTQVALPIDKKVEAEGNIVYRRMLGKGKILMAEVKGGPHTVETAFEKMQAFVEDHQHVAPAIPFESLITDRRQEQDTGKWITKIYWPVM